MPDFTYRELIELGHDSTPYRKLTADHVSRVPFDGAAMPIFGPNDE